jgi:Ca2+/Na+ antiporter
MTSLPAPTSTQTSVPGLSSSQAQYLASKTKSNRARKIGAIVGGVLSGIALVAASVALFLWRARINRRRTTRKAAEIIFANQAMPMQEKVFKGRDQEQARDVVPEAT